MDIYETLNCSKCHKYYKGHFKVMNDGSIICIDCKAKEKLKNKLLVKKLKGTLEQEWEDKEVLLRFNKDLDILSQLYKSDILNTVYKDSSDSFDSYTVYYQGNDLQFCFAMQDLAYDCLDYLFLGKEEYLVFCKDCINFYLSLRKEKIDKHKQELWYEKQKSKEYKAIKLEILDH